MVKQITIPGIFSALILIIVLGTLPNNSVTDTTSAVQNAGESYATDALIDSSGQLKDQLQEQSIKNACKNPESNACNTTKTNNAIISLVWIIVVLAVIIEGLIGFSKWIIRSVEFVADLF